LKDLLHQDSNLKTEQSLLLIQVPAWDPPPKWQKASNPYFANVNLSLHFAMLKSKLRLRKKDSPNSLLPRKQIGEVSEKLRTCQCRKLGSSLDRAQKSRGMVGEAGGDLSYMTMVRDWV
jgi:hypothetical protein